MLTIKKIRAQWKENYEGPLRLKDLQLYVEQAKRYIESREPHLNGFCHFSSDGMAFAGVINPYELWNALSNIEESVAHNWQRLRDLRAHGGSGRTPQRVQMVKVLLAELEPVVEKEKKRKH